MARAGLSPAAVIDAAAGLADEAGLGGVTLARLAERLGVKPPSLYKHVAGLDDILRGVALRGLREANARITRATVGLAREDALIALARAYWDFARQHPGLYAATVRAPAPGDPEVEAAGAALVETVLAVLRGYDLAGDDALHATRGLRAIIQGFLSLDAAGGFGLALDVEESFLRLVRTFAGGLGRTAGATEGLSGQARPGPAGRTPDAGR